MNKEMALRTYLEDLINFSEDDIGRAGVECNCKTAKRIVWSWLKDSVVRKMTEREKEEISASGEWYTFRTGGNNVNG